MSKSQFAVERLNWRAYEEPGYEPTQKAKLKLGAWARLPGSERVASFADEIDARADCQRREVVMRSNVNPFACGGPLCYQTSLDEGRLRDWMLDQGLTPPEAHVEGGWRAWWDQNHTAMTDLQKAKVWEALDKVRFFRVVPTRGQVLFVVVGAYWHYNDEYYYRQSDGLTPSNAYRTREAAEEYRREMEEFARDEMEMHPFQINGLCQWESWSTLPEQEAIERVKALGLPTPATDPHYGHAWETWWDNTEMEYDQEEAVWEMLDKIRFWEVVEVEMPG